jgi:hypothetical protein
MAQETSFSPIVKKILFFLKRPGQISIKQHSELEQPVLWPVTFTRDFHV